MAKKKAKAGGKKVKAARRAPAPKKSKKTAAPRVKARRVVSKKPAVTRGPALRPTTPPAPRPDPVREIAKRIVDLTVAGNDEASFALYADTVVSEEPGMPPMTGVDSIKQKFVGWRQMISNASWRARRVWVEGNAIAIEWVGQVTFAATGRQAEFKEVAIHEVENGRIVRERFYYDRSVLQS